MMPIVIFTTQEMPCKTAKEALLLLFEKVRDRALTVDEALACLFFMPSKAAGPDEPLRFKFDTGPDGFRLLLLMAQEGIHTPEKIVSTIAAE